MLKKYFLYILFALFIPGRSIFAYEDNLNFEITRLNSMFCHGDFAQLNQEIQSIPEMKDNITFRLIALQTKEGQLAALSFIQNTSKQTIPSKDTDRLYLAAALFTTYDPDKKRISDLFAFKASDPVLDAYRGVWQGAFESIDGNRKHAFSEVTEAFKRMPYLDGNILSAIFSLATGLEGAESKIAPYVHSIDLLSPNDSGKYLSMAYRDIILSPTEKRNEINEDYKKAYKLCKFDQSVAINYAGVLIHERKRDEAEKVFLSIVETRKFYSPYIDYILSQIYFAKHENELAEQFFKKAKDNLAYMPLRYRGVVQARDHFKKEFADFNDIAEESLVDPPYDGQPWFIWVISGLFLAIILFVVIKIRNRE